MTIVLIAYGPRFGGGARIADWIAVTMLEAGFDVRVGSAGDHLAIGRYDAVVLGGALTEGWWHYSARRFAREHAAELRRVPVWLFSTVPRGSSADPLPDSVVRAMGRTRARGHIAFTDPRPPPLDVDDRAQVRAWTEHIAKELS